MEMMSRNSRASVPTAAPAAPPPRGGGRRKHIDWAARTVRLELFIVLVGTALLLAALILYLIFSSSTLTTSSEYQRVDTSKYQAVFLNGGVTSGPVEFSTYFGHLKSINDNYLVLDNIYYLTSAQNQKTKTSNVQLTKLGCQQLHSPYDEMVINRNQVAFWENLRDDGKVAEAIKEFNKQNPDGPDCTKKTSQQPATSSQNAATTQEAGPTNNVNDTPTTTDNNNP